MSTDLVIHDVAVNFPDCLRDESRRTGKADSISFPKTENELVRVVRQMAASGKPITVQGARTGIAAGAVPDGGHIINLSRMDRILGLRQDNGTFYIRVQPGLLLSEFRTAIAKREIPLRSPAPTELAALADFRAAAPQFFPTDPTETSASIGGMVACNASGARSLFYGPIRRHVNALRVVLADGDILDLVRGRDRATGRAFHVRTTTGRTRSGTLPSYAMPNVKNASGYFAADDMDLVDLFIGSEGTLGLVSEIELRLTRLPAHIWGVMVFLPSEAASLPFVRQVRAARIKPVALEFFDSRALALLRRMKASNPAFAEIPVMPEAWNTGIYVEYHDDDESVIENGVDGLSRIFARLGGDEHATWLASDEHGMERLKAFRHHVPEAVNLTIDERRKTEPGITKLGTDLAVPDEHLENVLALYHADLDPTGLDYVMFGHIGNNHIHVNVIPSSMVQYDLGKSLYLGWARHVVAMGGTVSAEHGVGKIKTALLREMYGEAGIDQMRATRHSLDPASLLSPGNLF